jgi:hypothetical protein
MTDDEREDLVALADGDLRRWRGAAPGCERAVVDAVLTQTTRPVNDSAPYSGPLGYAATPGAPHGITVHFAEGVVEYISIAGPRLREPVPDVLGQPEGVLPSYLEGSTEQWAYPRTGLACHVRAGGQVSWLYAFAPMSWQTYQDSSLTQVRTLRHRRRR